MLSYDELQMEEKKSALEQQYITLLENRVAQLQKLVKPSSSDDRDVGRSYPFVSSTLDLCQVDEKIDD